MAEDKTRVLSSAEAARLFSRKPKVVGDNVVFYCDNGHRVVAPTDQVGKRGTCSKCGTPLLVPHAEAEADAEGVTTILSISRQSSAQDAPDVGGAAVEESGPAAEGNAGESGFGETAEAAAAEAFPNAAAAAPQEWTFVDDPAEAADDAVGWPGPVGAEPGDAEGLDNPTARLVARLWVEHELGGTLELHLQDGSVIYPQSYEPRWSLGTHGLFAAAAPDGSITLTAVAWDSVQKIIVRNVKGLPDGMFE